MSLTHVEQLASIRDEARVLFQRAGDHVGDLQALVAAADLHVRRAEEALSDALHITHGSVDHVRGLLCSQLQRSRESAETVRALSTGAHEQRAAVGLLLTHLDRNLNAGQHAEQRIRRDGVLVVDDYGDIREIVAEVLQNAGFVVRTAANGLEGLLAAYEMRPAVIVMDFTMPVLDGIQATRLIKSSAATRQARVIAYTGNPELDDSGIQELFVAVVQKPATPDDLLSTVRHVASL
jgi:CheY-like chemotaxis protein